MLEISLSGDHPTDLAKLVNAVLDSYMSLVVDEEQKERQARLEKLKELWKRYQNNLHAKRKELRELSETIGSNDKQTLTIAHQAKIQHLDVAEQEQMRVKFELRKAEAELAVLEAQVNEADSGTVPSAAIDEQVEASPAILELKNRIQMLTNQYNRVAHVARIKSDPAVLAVRKQLDTAQRDLAAYRARLRPAIATEIRNAAQKDDWANLVKLRRRSVWRKCTRRRSTRISSGFRGRRRPSTGGVWTCPSSRTRSRSSTRRRGRSGPRWRPWTWSLGRRPAFGSSIGPWFPPRRTSSGRSRPAAPPRPARS